MSSSTTNPDDSPSTSNPPISALFPPIIPNTAYLIDEDSRPVQILRPYTTQRCFTFCSQSSVRRDTGWDPVCRAVCWKVDRSDELRVPGNREGWLDRERAGRAGRAGETSTSASTSTSTLAQRRASQVAEEPSTSILDEFRHSVSHWINQRSLTAFRGTLSEMVDMQREGQAYDPAWDSEGSLKSNYFDTMGRQPNYGNGLGMDGDGRGRAQRRWEEMSGLEDDLKEVYAKEYAAAQAQQTAQTTSSSVEAEVEQPMPVRPTTLAERQFMKLVREEQAHLERHQKQRLLARSGSGSGSASASSSKDGNRHSRDHGKWEYHAEPLPSGGTHLTLPLSTILITPWYKLLHRTEFIFSPFFRLSSSYLQTFYPDPLTGKSTQERGLERMVEQVKSGKVLEFGERVLERCGQVWGGWLGLSSEEGRGKEDGGNGSGSGAGRGQGGRKEE